MGGGFFEWMAHKMGLCTGRKKSLQMFETEEYLMPIEYFACDNFAMEECEWYEPDQEGGDIAMDSRRDMISSYTDKAEEYMMPTEHFETDELESSENNQKGQNFAKSFGDGSFFRHSDHLPVDPRKQPDVTDNTRVYSWVEQLEEFRHYKRKDKDGCFDGDDYKVVMHPSMGMVILFILDVGLVISVNSHIFKASSSVRKRNPLTGRFRSQSMNDTRIWSKKDLTVELRHSSPIL